MFDFDDMRKARLGLVAPFLLVWVASIACQSSRNNSNHNVADGGRTDSGDASVDDATTAPEPQRFELVPEVQLVPALNGQFTFDVIGFDPIGAVPFAVQWSSVHSDVATMDSSGVATAHTWGSTRIQAHGPEGELLGEALLIVAEPVADALLIDDSDVLLAQELLSPDDTPLDELVFRSLLATSTAPVVGEAIMATGKSQIGGIVTAVTPTETGYDVHWRAVPPDALFETLVLDEDIPMEVVELPSNVALLGPSCSTANIGLFTATLTKQVNLTNTLRFEQRRTNANGWERAVVHGSIKGGIGIDAELSGGVSANATWCSHVTTVRPSLSPWKCSQGQTYKVLLAPCFASRRTALLRWMSDSEPREIPKVSLFLSPPWPRTLMGLCTAMPSHQRSVLV